MGLILDSTAAVAADREGKTARQLLEAVALRTGDDEIAISVMTVLELAHGVERANTLERRSRRHQFLTELIEGVPVHPITISIARAAGRLDGQYQARGIRVPLSDLLIGVTALELGYSVATSNLRHFKFMPALDIVEL